MLKIETTAIKIFQEKHLFVGRSRTPAMACWSCSTADKLFGDAPVLWSDPELKVHFSVLTGIWVLFLFYNKYQDSQIIETKVCLFCFTVSEVHDVLALLFWICFERIYRSENTFKTKISVSPRLKCQRKQEGAMFSLKKALSYQSMAH